MSSIIEGNEEHMDNPAIIISLDGLRLILSYLSKSSLNLEQLLANSENPGATPCKEEQEPEDFKDPEVNSIVTQYYARHEMPEEELLALKAVMLEPQNVRYVSEQMTRRGFSGWREKGNTRQASGRIRALVQKGLVKRLARGIYAWNEGGELE
jgi:hypothetical protein